MKPVILCYEKCATCKKALKWVGEKVMRFRSVPSRKKTRPQIVA